MAIKLPSDYKPPSTLENRRIATQVYGGKAPTAYKVYTPPKKKKAPTTIQAVAGDDFNMLASKLGVDVQDVVTANPNVTTVKAGTFLNAPDPNASFNVPTKPDNITMDEWTASLKPVAPTPVPQRQSFFDWGMSQPGGNAGGGLQNWAGNFAEWVGNLVTPKETLSSGEGKGGVVKPQAEYADFRQAEAAAAYQDREARFMTGSLGITAMRDKPGYYGQYGTEQDLANQANGDFSKLYNPMYTPSATQTLGEKLDAGEYSPDAVPPQTAEEALRQMWEDVYMNPANKGRGGGIVGWIEERTGIAIDPETFFTEGASSEVLARMLEVFRPDELNYLESHGFLVPVEDYDLPNYNYPAPSYYRSQGGGGGGYGGYGSGPSGQVPRQTYLGLVSWSI